MDEQSYLAAHTRAAAIEIAADLARAQVMCLTELRGGASRRLQDIHAQIEQLKTDPGRHGALYTRTSLKNAIAALEADAAIEAATLAIIEPMYAKAESDYSARSNQRYSVSTLMQKLRADRDALRPGAESVYEIQQQGGPR